MEAASLSEPNGACRSLTAAGDTAPAEGSSPADRDIACSPVTAAAAREEDEFPFCFRTPLASFNAADGDWEPELDSDTTLPMLPALVNWSGSFEPAAAGSLLDSGLPFGRRAQVLDSPRPLSLVLVVSSSSYSGLTRIRARFELVAISLGKMLAPVGSTRFLSAVVPSDFSGLGLAFDTAVA